MGLLALVLAVVGGVLLGWGLKDAAPFLYFSTEEEVVARQHGEQMMEIATAVLLAASVLLMTIGKWGHAFLVAAIGVATTGLLSSPLGQSLAPHLVFVLLVPASSAAVVDASGLASLLKSRPRASRSAADKLALALFLVVTLFTLVYAAGPIGVAGTALAPLIFWFSLRSLQRAGDSP